LTVPVALREVSAPIGAEKAAVKAYVVVPTAGGRRVAWGQLAWGRHRHRLPTVAGSDGSRGVFAYLRKGDVPVVRGRAVVLRVSVPAGNWRSDVDDRGRVRLWLPENQWQYVQTTKFLRRDRWRWTWRWIWRWRGTRVEGRLSDLTDVPARTDGLPAVEGLLQLGAMTAMPDVGPTVYREDLPGGGSRLWSVDPAVSRSHAEAQVFVAEVNRWRGGRMPVTRLIRIGSGLPVGGDVGVAREYLPVTGRFQPTDTLPVRR
jgi:hypothetical protein